MLGDDIPAAQSASDEPSVGPLARLRLAVAFLTRFPVAVPAEAVPLARAVPAFPLVGAGVGAAAAALYALAAFGLPPWLAALLAQGGALLLTGALHEDGLADLADGLGARGGREARLAAMRDSHLGSFGALALGWALAARVGALAALGSTPAVAGALVAAHALARAAIGPALRRLPPARPDGLGAAAGTPTASEAGFACVIAVGLAAVVLPPLAALAALAGAAIGALAIGWLARRTLGGQTGDVLGAIEQAAETLALLAIVAAER